MKIFSLHHNTTPGHLAIKRFFWVAFLFSFSQAVQAQKGGESACFFNLSYQIECNNITVRFGGNANWPFHQWNFGDGSPIITGLPPVYHTYVDVNPYINPITASHYTDQWCDQIVDFPGIFLGTGCGSQRKVSDMVATNKLPANELVGKNLYVFGDLEVDASYIFNGCNIFISEGGKITVKSGAILTLKSNTVVDAHAISGVCDGLWNGIIVYSGGSLITDGATIQNAYFAVRPIKDNAVTLPVLSLKNTSFKRDFVGVYAADGSFVLSNFKDNTFEGSGNTPIYHNSNCNPQNVLPYAQRTYCGIYFNGWLGGSLLMPNKSTNNLFKDLQAGIVCLNGTSSIQGCRFDNIAHLQGNTALYQGTAITFIDNFGKKALTLLGLGKTGIPTVNNCERGVYATTSVRPSAVNISNCRMIEVQNGIDIDATGIGNFTKGVIKDNYIGCTKYLPIIKERSIGILWRDPSVLFSNFSITGNDIDVDQPEAYPAPSGLDEDILPTGINVIAMHNQASSTGLTLDISTNQIDLIKGHQGIIVENVTNATIIGNNILHDNNLYTGRSQIGIHVIAGLNNTVNCNIVTQTHPLGAYIAGLACEASPGMTMAQNTADNTFASISFVFDNGTNCRVQYNDLKYNLGIPGLLPTGLYYNDAQTGPQNLQGNDWVGDFVRGALYQQGAAAYTYCNSLYSVSEDANVDNAINPVIQGNQQICAGMATDWFTVLELGETDYACAQAFTPPNGVEKNEADLNLAGGGTSNLSPGYKWSSEIGLYQKFAENPDLAIGDEVINGFMQAQQGQPVAAMYAVRNDVNGIEGSIDPALLANIQNTLAQLESDKASLLVFLENIDTDPNALASFTTLNTQIEALEQLLQTYLESASSSMA